jgi:hypothetical protein
VVAFPVLNDTIMLEPSSAIVVRAAAEIERLQALEQLAMAAA